MRLIEWEVTEDSYQEQINIPKMPGSDPSKCQGLTPASSCFHKGYRLKQGLKWS
jgi:hypothetical protein